MPSRINFKFLSEHIMVKYENTKNKEKNPWNSQRGKTYCLYRTRITLFSEFSSLPLNAVRKEII